MEALKNQGAEDEEEYQDEEQQQDQVYEDEKRHGKRTRARDKGGYVGGMWEERTKE